MWAKGIPGHPLGGVGFGLYILFDIIKEAARLDK
jgi:hypothetical protein